MIAKSVWDETTKLGQTGDISPEIAYRLKQNKEENNCERDEF